MGGKNRGGCANFSAALQSSRGLHVLQEFLWQNGGLLMSESLS